VKNALFYILFVFAGPLGFSQASKATIISAGFPDSVRIILENTKNIDAGVIGGGFATAWGNLSVDQQQTIRSHMKIMKQKKYAVKPHLITSVLSLMP
jgi:hypothetical protein